MGGVSLAFISPLGPSQDSKIKQKSQKCWRPRDCTNPLGSLWAGLSCGIQISQEIKDPESWKLLTRQIPRQGLSKLGLPYTAAPTECRTVPTCQDWGCARTGAPAAQAPPPRQGEGALRGPEHQEATAGRGLRGNPREQLASPILSSARSLIISGKGLPRRERRPLHLAAPRAPGHRRGTGWTEVNREAAPTPPWVLFIGMSFGLRDTLPAPG